MGIVGVFSLLYRLHGVLSEESFMENTTDWLSNLKLRASYGTTGNDLDVMMKK